MAGGKLQLKIKKLNVSGLITDLPEFIEVDISELEIGKSVKVKDINVDSLQLLDSENNSIVSCVVTRAARSAADGGEEADDSTSEEGEASEEKAEG
jgi:large subunit ribosomal protein L25